MVLLKNILLPVDFSESSLAATRLACEFALRFSAKLHVLHVIEDPMIYLPIFETFPMPSRQQFEIYAQDRLENWLPDEFRQMVDYELYWYHGQIVSRVVEFARDHRMDLMIVGTHGRGGLNHAMLGSVTEKLIRSSPCPVLSVRSPEKPATTISPQP